MLRNINEFSSPSDTSVLYLAVFVVYLSLKVV